MTGDRRKVTAAELLDVATVERLNLGPGDIVVLKFRDALSAEDAQRIRRDFEAGPLAGVPLLILDQCTDIAVLRANP